MKVDQVDLTEHRVCDRSATLMDTPSIQSSVMFLGTNFLDHRLGVAGVLILCLNTSIAQAHSGFIQDISTATVSTHYLVSEHGSDGRMGIGYRTGFLGIFGLCALTDLDYRFERSALEGRFGIDMWIAYWGLRTDLLVRHELSSQRTSLGLGAGLELLLSESLLVYAGTHFVRSHPVEGSLGLTWLFDGL